MDSSMYNILQSLHGNRPASGDTDKEKSLSEEELPSGDDLTLQEETAVKKPEPVRKPPKAKKTAAVRTVSDGQKPVRIDIPYSLVKLVEDCVPGNMSRSGKMAAFLYSLFSEQKPDVPDAVRENAKLVNAVSLSSLQGVLLSRLDVMSERMQKFNRSSIQQSSELWYMTAYLLLNLIGEVPRPSMNDLSFADERFDTLREQVRQQMNEVRLHLSDKKEHPSVARVEAAKNLDNM